MVVHSLLIAITTIPQKLIACYNFIISCPREKGEGDLIAHGKTNKICNFATLIIQF